ncbi:hypothetical protein KAFR_0A02390 [Kazachstania africana CBS 2517]|uniref:Poly A polymerase head domain-containing protein n=1 Tax=Kazachstania africana (strain ATCC 22294 / BCRC 22015 / CBS 2517 / CECT 1963 / NBRC 1671 / NRRL Y-8276) TaxID=1071382 RepID=H2AMS7_KAZAF|nr:hypothetical protein KAFR_0A02390 [Kazachstania africana CBS 2517]CCF55677.1 hypothetical protein KAFR_0A02390 [Kazachstania africana CBS 2517]
MSINLSDDEEHLCSYLRDFIRDLKQFHWVKIWITGGWVRDKLLGYNPHDIDIVVIGLTGPDFMNHLKKYHSLHYNQYLPSHIIKANSEKGKAYDIAATKLFDITLDFTGIPLTTEFGDSISPRAAILQDVYSRDLTINTLYYNIFNGKIEDYSKEGLSDIENELIDTVALPYETLAADPLRVLRIIRFATFYRFKILQETFKAMQNSDIHYLLSKRVARERFSKEIEKIFDDEDVEIGLKLIHNVRIESIIFDWTGDEYLKKYNIINNPDIGLISFIYRHGVLRRHLRKIYTKYNGFFEFATYDLIEMLTDSLSKRIFLLSIILYPMKDIEIIAHPKKLYKRNLPLSEMVVKEGLKRPGKEAKLVSQIVDGLSDSLSTMSENFDLDDLEDFEDQYICQHCTPCVDKIKVYVAEFLLYMGVN